MRFRSSFDVCCVLFRGPSLLKAVALVVVIFNRLKKSIFFISLCSKFSVLWLCARVPWRWGDEGEEELTMAVLVSVVVVVLMAL